jgi:hypothetical protein
LAAALGRFHPKLRGLASDLPFVWDERTLRNGTIFTLTTDLGDIHLLAEVIDLGDFEDVKRSSVQVETFDRTVWTLDLPGLIQSKRAAGRDKDLRILPELEGLLELREPED